MIQPTLFVPALSMSEAEARISALAGGVVSDTRGPKRSLVALADALAIDTPAHHTNGTLGRHLAEALGAPWPVSATTSSDQVTLHGLNTLLEAAHEHFLTHAPPTPRSLPRQFADPSWSWFLPARSKIEAVNRISSLTGSGPEALGPGGKERKSVFVNLALRAGLALDTSLSKVELGNALAQVLGVTWTPTCASTGYTITLEGLNVVLAGAERLLSGGISTAPDPVREARLLVGLLAAEFSDGAWDGKEAVVEMRDDGYSQWRQMEWPGFYYEYRGLRALYTGAGQRSWTQPSQRYGATTFDFVHDFVWDLKAHTSRVRADPPGVTSTSSGTAPLNDRVSTDLCAADTGVGLLVMHGEALVDGTGVFDAWHKAATRAGRPMPTVAPPTVAFSRARKKGFTPLSLGAYRWNTLAEVQAAMASGGLRLMHQGRQASGAPRPQKYMLDTRRAQPWLVESATLTSL